MAFYNASLVQREHPHLCSLRNKRADVRYTALHSKRPGEMMIELSGHKSGTRNKSHSYCSWHDAEEFDFFQASHLCVSITVHKRLLTYPLDTYPCRKLIMYTRPDTPVVEFNLHDANAVKDLLHRIDQTYQCILPMLVKFFVDWAKLDALREKRTAAVIQRQMMATLYSPDSTFYKTQSRSNAPLIMRGVSSVRTVD